MGGSVKAGEDGRGVRELQARMPAVQLPATAGKMQWRLLPLPVWLTSIGESDQQGGRLKYHGLKIGNPKLDCC